MPVISPEEFIRVFVSLPHTDRKKFVRDLWEMRGYTLEERPNGFAVASDGECSFLEIDWDQDDPIRLFSTPDDSTTSDLIISYRISDLATQLNYAIATPDAHRLQNTYFLDLETEHTRLPASIPVSLIALTLICIISITIAFTLLPLGIDSDNADAAKPPSGTLQTTDTIVEPPEADFAESTTSSIPDGIGRTGITDLALLLELHYDLLATTPHYLDVNHSGGSVGNLFDGAESGSSSTIYNNQTNYYSRSKWQFESAENEFTTRTTEEYRSGGSLHLQHVVANQTTIHSSNTYRFQPDETSDLSSNAPILYQDVISLMSVGLSTPGTTVDHVTVDDDSYSVIALDGRIREFGPRENFSPPISESHTNYYRITTHGLPSEFPVDVDAYRATIYVTGDGLIVRADVFFVNADTGDSVDLVTSIDPADEYHEIDPPGWYPATPFGFE